MKIKTLFSVFLVLFVLVACFGQETFHFKGEGDNWRVEYVTNVVASDNSESGTIKLMYIGESEEPTRIDYRIKGGSGEMSGEISGDTSPWEISGSNCSGCATAKKDDEFDVTIKWDEKSENFTLKTVD